MTTSVNSTGPQIISNDGSKKLHKIQKVMSFVLFFCSTVRPRSVDLRPLNGPILTSRVNKYGTLMEKIWTKEDRRGQK
jgi:hypothetical protein